MLGLSIFIVILLIAIIVIVIIRTRDDTPSVQVTLQCPLTMVVRSAGCIIPISWQAEVENDSLRSVEIELIRYDYASQNILNRMLLSDLSDGEMEIPTDDPRFFSESGRYKILVTGRSNRGAEDIAQHLFEYHFNDAFTYFDSVGRAQSGNYISEDRSLVRRGISFVGSGSLSSFPELPDKRVAHITTCPKASALVAVEYYNGYHIANALPINGVRLLNVILRRLGSRDLLAEHQITREQTITLDNPLLIDEGIEILIEMRDPDNPSGSVYYSSADLKYHFVRVP
ncbi:hypothetical protein [Agarivorans sp. DSG3-1]|uniref:hypothetical protein n=1 Tax=Agarivorans sp. DSG3-1 TaxID=3342249 RepID=UPI00398ED253